MADVISEIKGVGGSNYAVGGVYILMSGLLLSDVTPTPSDAWFFSYTRKLRNQYFANEISPKQFWDRTALAYYFFNALWWIFLFIVVILTKGGAGNKMKVFLALLGAGIVFAVIHNNITKDEQQKALEAESKIPKS